MLLWALLLVLYLDEAEYQFGLQQSLDDNSSGTTRSPPSSGSSTTGQGEFSFVASLASLL